jgi:hypothetical protein
LLIIPLGAGSLALGRLHYAGAEDVSAPNGDLLVVVVGVGVLQGGGRERRHESGFRLALVASIAR